MLFVSTAKAQNVFVPERNHAYGVYTTRNAYMQNQPDVIELFRVKERSKISQLWFGSSKYVLQYHDGSKQRYKKYRKDFFCFVDSNFSYISHKGDLNLFVLQGAYSVFSKCKYESNRAILSSNPLPPVSGSEKCKLYVICMTDGRIKRLSKKEVIRIIHDNSDLLDNQLKERKPRKKELVIVIDKINHQLMNRLSE